MVTHQSLATLGNSMELYKDPKAPVEKRVEDLLGLLTAAEKLEMLLALAKYPKVFVKISHMWSLSKEAYPYADAMAQVRNICHHFGVERL